MGPVLSWSGDVASILALRGSGATAVRLVASAGGVPDFLLEDQVAALGLRLTKEEGEVPPGAGPRALAEALAFGYRAVVWKSGPRAGAPLAGRVLDQELLAELGEAAAGVETFVFDGPGFRRRVDVIVGDVDVDDSGAARAVLGLRGC